MEGNSGVIPPFCELLKLESSYVFVLVLELWFGLKWWGSYVWRFFIRWERRERRIPRVWLDMGMGIKRTSCLTSLLSKEKKKGGIKLI